LRTAALGASTRSSRSPQARSVSICAREDLEELFRRIALSLMINNTDDHLRNHGLLRSGSGWRLSPVFDINPNPEASAIRSTSVFSEYDREPALAALLSNAHEFELTHGEAEAIVADVAGAVGMCESFAVRTGIGKAERETILRALHN